MIRHGAGERPGTRQPRAGAPLNRVMSLLFCSLLGVGCLPSEHGRTSAAKTGQLVEPPARRADPAAPLVDACGRSEIRTGTLLRMPYVQAVDSHSAALLWTSASADPEDVIATRGDDEIITTAAQLDPTEALEAGVQRIARLSGLWPDTAYCYTVRDDTGTEYGPFGFRTAPAAGSPRPLDVLVFGDSGSGHPDQYALARQMHTVPIDLILHTGDLAGPSGAMWQLEDQLFTVYEDLLRSFPLFPTAGEKDLAVAGGGPFRDVFHLPGQERWYSFDWGTVHFVALDTREAGPAQAEWLERDLADSALPWTVVYTHAGPYSSGAHGGSTAFRELYEPTLVRYGVQLVMSGQDHDYERFEPIGGVTYVVTGGGGEGTLDPNPSARTAFSEGVTHFVSLHVERDVMTLHAIDAAGREFDSVDIARVTPATFPALPGPG